MCDDDLQASFPTPPPGCVLPPTYVAALRLDAMAARVARSQGAIDLALGETLLALFEGDRLDQLKVFSCRGDYLRERVGLGSPRAVFLWMELAQGLKTRPILRRALVAGAVSPRKALTVMELATGDGEAVWTAAAMNARLEDLEEALKSEGKEPPGGPYEVESLYLLMTAEQQDRFDAGLAAANETLGFGAPKWQCQDAVYMEWLSGFAAWAPDRREEQGGARGPGGEPGAGGARGPADAAPVGSAKGAGPGENGARPRRPLSKEERRRLERTVARQICAIEDALSAVENPCFHGDDGIDGKRGLGCAHGHPVVEGVEALDEKCPPDALALDARVQCLLAARKRYDEVLGILLLEVVSTRAWEFLHFRTFEAYCRERLLISARTARQRVWLERKMRELPALRAALARGELTYSKALLVARDATPRDVVERIARAAKTTGQQVQREAEAREERQNRAQGVRRVYGPREVFENMVAAVQCAQAWSRDVRKEEVDAGEAHALMGDYTVKVWEAHRPKLNKEQRERRDVLLRHGGLCAVPMCSRRVQHLHHVVWRSRLGPDEPWNLVGTCSYHHLRCIHRGRLRVTGRAGEKLTWVFATGEVWVTEGDDDVHRAEGGP